MLSSAIQQIQVLQSYGPQGFKVNDVFHTTPILLSPDCCVPWCVEMAVGQWGIEHFQPILELAKKPEVVLIGTGRMQQFLSASVKEWLRAQGIICETMSTAAACRTYSVLVAEDRNVAAAMVPSFE